MLSIELNDGTIKTFDHQLSVLEVARNISSSLAKSTIAGEVDGVLVDSNFIITKNSKLKLINEQDKLALDIIRHSAAHLLAQAVKQLYPQAQVTIGPVINDGFYYDFSFERSFTPDDLIQIEHRMQELVQQNIPVTRIEISRAQAIDFFLKQGENYKIELINSIAPEQTISLYQQGDFSDLCRGPHVASTGRIKAFKLMKLAGAYWRGDSKNAMLQRIYGTAFANKEQLQAYLTMLEQAEKRDHRKIAKQLDLFHLQEEAPGMVFWHAKGWTLWQIIEQYMRSMYLKHDYQEVKTPQILDRKLWEQSGHWEKFRQDMFSLTSDERQYAIKPMNCPAHVQIFKQGITSYKQLPIRLAEFGSCHRNEATGALHGIMRTRNFTQDDGHIFCTSEQIKSEVINFIAMLFEVYAKFDLHDIAIKLSTRPQERIGSEAMWDQAEQALADALDSEKLAWELLIGEGAFYGPKIEFVIKDCIGRSWTTGTIQLDFSMPQRLGAEYINHHDERVVPVMLHRAICGSLERFIGILIEHHAGNLPLWLAPIQMVILNISQQQISYCELISKQLTDQGFRSRLDCDNQKISYKIREQTLQKIPYMVIIGAKEVVNNSLTIRMCNGKDLGNMHLNDFIELIKTELKV